VDRLVVVVGVIASARGRSGFGYFLLSIILSPLIGLLIVAFSPSLRDAPSAETHVKCPMCAEPILKAALKCKHCGHVFEKSAADREREALRERSDRVAAAVRDFKFPWQTDAARKAAEERDKQTG
jgi:hypothetical protein